ncbi:MAG: PilZ domain-containing protein [Chloroflexota bacterium]
MMATFSARGTERRHARRQPFSLYIRVLDDETDKTLGFLEEIGEGGFRLETNESFPLQKEYDLRMEVTPDVSDKLFIFVKARTKWSKPDIFRPDIFHVGFKIMNVGPHDHEIFRRMLDKYGK